MPIFPPKGPLTNAVDPPQPAVLTLTVRLRPWVIPAVRLLRTACLYHLPLETALRAADALIRRGLEIGRPA